MSSPTNPYTSVSVSGYDANPPPDDGTRTSDNKVEWAKHKEKHGDPLKTAIEGVNTNVASAFGDLIMTDDPGQDTVIEGMRRFMPRALDSRVESGRILARVESPLSENQITINAVFS